MASTSTSTRDNLWLLLNTEVAHISSQGDILLAGDFNARTGVLPAHNVYDSTGCVPLPTEYRPDPGSEIQFRQRSQFLWKGIIVYPAIIILNGRIGIDRNVGAFTCYTPRGCSVVDYFVVSEHFMIFISDMSVHDLSEYSDHRSILLTIKRTKRTRKDEINRGITEKN